MQKVGKLKSDINIMNALIMALSLAEINFLHEVLQP